MVIMIEYTDGAHSPDWEGILYYLNLLKMIIEERKL